MKVYRGKISYLSPLLFFPGLFTFAIVLEGDLKVQWLNGIMLVWAFFLALMLIPLGYKLEVGDNFVRNSFLNFTMSKLYSYNVESVKYGGILLWGGMYGTAPVHGKGLAILTYVDGTRKIYGFSEKLYGKKAIEHLRMSLEVKG